MRLLGLLLCAGALAACTRDRISATIPELSVEPTVLDFGRVYLGQRGTALLRLHGTGTSEVVVTLGLAPAPFGTEGASEIAVPAGDTVEVIATFVPTEAGPAHATLSYQSTVYPGVAAEVGLIGEGVAVPDCDDHNPCTDEHFDLASGSCVSEEHFGPCDDGSACTVGDFCSAGKCVGQALYCDDGNACTIDTCAARTGCVHSPDPACGEDRCLVTQCSPAGCTKKTAPDGTLCGNYVPCGMADLCLSGRCTPVDQSTDPACNPPPPCIGDAACDDGNPCSADRCTATGCVHPAAVDGTVCGAQLQCGALSCQQGACVSVSASGQWRHELVDGGGRVAVGTTGQVDPAGVLHVAYGLGCLKYATLGASGWSIEKINSLNHGSDISLAFDSTGAAHLSYVVVSRTEFYRYLRRNPDGTELDEPLAFTSPISWQGKLAVDADGNPHLAYVPQVNGRFDGVRWAQRDAGGQWTEETVFPTLGLFGLAVDAARVRHLLYNDAYDTVGLIHASAPLGGPWAREAIPGIGRGMWTPVLAADGSVLRAIFADQWSSALMYAEKPAAGSWKVELVDPSMNNDGNQARPALAVSPSGEVYVAYFDSSPHELRLAKRDLSGNWQNELVLAAGNYPAARYLSAVFDGAGMLHLVYSDNQQAWLWHSYRCP